MNYLCRSCGKEQGESEFTGSRVVTALASEANSSSCFLCDKKLQLNDWYYTVPDAKLVALETKLALRDGFMLGEKEAKSVWHKLHGTNMPERLKLSDLVAKKYGLP